MSRPGQEELSLSLSKVSQGSVATRLRCGGIFNDQSVVQSLLIPMVRLENRSTFAEDMGKNQVCCY